MRSQEGAIFFVINLVGNFGTVFMDNGYYNKAIAASPVHALPGYVMGGLSWFAIPFLCATTMGLSALALEGNPVFPTYPSRMDSDDVTAGLVLPYAAVALLGKGGAAATLLLIFMAVTSASSSEYIAVSSIFTYDIYQTYYNPRASGKMLINMAHTMVVIYAILLAAFSTGLYYAGISMGYLYLMMGVIISSAVVPATLTLMWSKQNLAAAALSPILGLICSLIAWLVTAKKQGGDLSVASTGANNPMLAGNVVALLSPLIFIPVLTYTFGPQNYDYKSMAAIRLGNDEDIAEAAHTDLELVPGANQLSADENEAEQKKLRRASRIARSLTGFLTIALLVLWPMPMYGSEYVFSKKFFTGWVVVGILWLFCSSFCVGLFPLWEGRHSMARTFMGIVRDLSGKGGPARRASVVEGREVSESPVGEKAETVVTEKVPSN
ncbi:urea active transporter [Lecanora helva]